MTRSNFNILTYKKALDFSYNYYRARYRKGLKIPYFTYLSSVSNLVIENNGYAQSTPIELNLAGSIRKRVEAFDIEFDEIKSSNVLILL